MTFLENIFGGQVYYSPPADRFLLGAPRLSFEFVMQDPSSFNGLLIPVSLIHIHQNVITYLP